MTLMVSYNFDQVLPANLEVTDLVTCRLGATTLIAAHLTYAAPNSENITFGGNI